MNWSTTVFLAYASEDKPFVRRLYSLLKEHGLKPWLDEEDLDPGAKWDDTIVTQVYGVLGDPTGTIIIKNHHEVKKYQEKFEQYWKGGLSIESLKS